MSDDAVFYGRALNRIDRISIGLGVIAVIVMGLIDGWKSGLACAAAAAISVYNFQRLKRLARAIESSRETPRSSATAVLLGLRYILLLGACFVIIKVFGVSVLAIFAGLMISVAAVLIEIVYELIFHG